MPYTEDNNRVAVDLEQNAVNLAALAVEELAQPRVVEPLGRLVAQLESLLEPLGQRTHRRAARAR